MAEPSITELPIIDYKANNADLQFTQSLVEYGFAAFRNHPLDITRINRIYRDWAAFFASDKKFDYTYSKQAQDGFFSMDDAESAKGTDVKDYKEYYHYYTWGRCPDELKQDIADYYKEAHDFAAILLRWVEQYTPANIATHYSEPLSNMIEASELTLLRILHYPPVPQGQEVCRASAHEDINLLTILPAAAGAGLEIQAMNDEWVSVPPNPETVLVNIGDMLQEASGGYYPSTTHRVAAPAVDQANLSRMSLPLFLHPRPDVKLSDRYTSEQYLQERLKELGVI